MKHKIINLYITFLLFKYHFISQSGHEIFVKTVLTTKKYIQLKIMSIVIKTHIIRISLD